MSHEDLRAYDELRSALKAIGEAEDGPMFMGWPDRWYEGPPGRGTPLWRCPNEHVSEWYVKSEERGALCPAGSCQEHVVITFPEDVEGPLVAPERS